MCLFVATYDIVSRSTSYYNFLLFIRIHIQNNCFIQKYYDIIFHIL